MNLIEDPSWGLAVLEAAPNTMLVVDGKGRVVFANEQAQRTFGRPRSALVGTPFGDVLAVASRSAFRDGLKHLLGTPATGEPPASFEVMGLGKRGEPLPLELSMGKMVSGDERLAIVVLFDLTGENQAKAALAASLAQAREFGERLEAILEFAPAFIIGIDLSGGINFINRTLAQYSKQDVIGSSWLLYFPPERQVLMEEKLAAAYATGATQFFETSTAGPDGRPLWFDSYIAPIREHGTLAGAVLVSQEVTERKRAQEEVRASRHMGLLGTLAAGVAHEINTPIQFVGDSLQFLRDSGTDLLTLIERLQHLRRAAVEGGPLPDLIAAATEAEVDADLPYIREAMPAAFDRCVDGLSRVSTIVRSLKDFAHPSEKGMTPTDLNRAIQSALTIATNEYKYVATLRLELGDLPPVTCNHNDVSQAVLNIVVNAAHAIGDTVKGTDQTGVITVRTTVEGAEVVIAISDTGGGIPENIRSKVFDPFFTTKEVGRGTGQGLAIARATVKEGHGGDITFESEVGKGTTFFIRLPIGGRIAD